jgi:threonine/homoserine/homoserine lactone efflux protein
VDLFFRGAVIGLAIAAPVGPIGVLCIRRTIAGGMRLGFVCGLGAATADALYAGIATFALTLATAYVARITPPQAYAGAFLSTFALTAVNPATILSFAAVVAGAAFGAQPPAGVGAVRLVAGVFAGSALWWLVLSGGVAFVRRGLSATAARAVNIASGIVLAGFGVVAIALR